MYICGIIDTVGKILKNRTWIMKKILAVDGNSIINRAFYGIKLLDNGKGLYTNAIFGMINILNKNIELVNPDICVAAFDLSAPTFRHKRFTEYKAGRHKMPEELAMQLPYAKKVLRAMGFVTLEKEGYEADDILGTVASIGEKEGCEVYVLTGDRDSLQLISDNTKVLLVKNNETLCVDESNFSSVYPVPLSQFVDLKALMGDSSDNIPGVPGVGEKTAAKLLSDFGSLDAIFEGYASSSLSPSVKKKLEAGRESAFLSRELATIVRDAPIDFSIDENTYKGFDRAEAYALFKELNFTKFIEKYGLTEDESDASEKLHNDKKVYSVFELANAPSGEYTVSFTDGVLTAFDGESIYRSDNADEVLHFLEQNSILSVDSKALYNDLEKIGVHFRNAAFDFILCAYVCDSNVEYTVEKLFSMYDAVEHEEICVRAFSVLDVLKKKLSEIDGDKLLYEIELPLAAILCDMERAGFKIDVDGLKEYGAQLSSELEKIEYKIYEYAGVEFNINSPKQLGEVLFERLELPAQKKTKTGYSTNAEVLEKIKMYHPIVPLILEYRKLGKLIGTYVDGLIAAADGEGKVHSVFKQAATATGRLSSAEPNLQNIPIKTEEGRYLRRFFIPSDKDNVFIDADYSQIELRLLASISEDESMCDAFNNGADIHTATAATVFGVPFEEVTPLMRKRAKAVNFGIMYGMGEYSLAEDLGIPMKEAKTYIQNYLARFPKITEYFQRTNESAYADGYVSTMFGRRRYIPELKASNKMLRAFGERVARNSPIQGSAADIIKIAMIRVSERLKRECPTARLILQVHDELLIEAPRDGKELACRILCEEMENAVSLGIKLSVEAGIGETWYECK